MAPPAWVQSPALREASTHPRDLRSIVSIRYLGSFAQAFNYFSHDDVGEMDSWTSSPTAALAAVSAALLTPTHRPPPATSIVLPVNGVPLVPVTRICRRPPRSATNGAGISTGGKPTGLVVSPSAYPCAEGHHAEQHHMSARIRRSLKPVRHGCREEA